MRRCTPIALSLLLLALSTGCGTGAGAATPVHAALAADYSTADNQYRQLQIGLTLPKDVSFPEHLPKTGDHYPLDAGTVTAQNYWLCAWLRSYLTSTPSANDQPHQALQQLPTYIRMEAYTKALDARGRSVVDTVIRDAHKGAKKSVTEFTQASCGGPFYGRAHPSPGAH